MRQNCVELGTQSRGHLKNTNSLKFTEISQKLGWALDFPQDVGLDAFASFI